MPPPRPSPPRLATLFLLAGLMTLSLNMFLPTLSTMAVDFEVDYSVISLALGLYLASTAVLQLIIGPLSDRWGRRPILLISLVIFTGASLVCALTGYIWMFLGFRVLQGAVISAWVLALAAVRDTHSQASGASLVGYISMTMAIASMLGPTGWESSSAGGRFSSSMRPLHKARYGVGFHLDIRIGAIFCPGSAVIR